MAHHWNFTFFFCGLFLISPVNAVGSIKCGRFFGVFFRWFFMAGWCLRRRPPKRLGWILRTIRWGWSRLQPGENSLVSQQQKKNFEKRYVSRWPLGFCWENSRMKNRNMMIDSRWREPFFQGIWGDLIWYSGKRTSLMGLSNWLVNEHEDRWEHGHLFGRYLVYWKCVIFQPAMVIYWSCAFLVYVKMGFCQNLFGALFWDINIGFCQNFVSIWNLFFQTSFLAHHFHPMIQLNIPRRTIRYHVRFKKYSAKWNDNNPHFCSFVHRLVEVFLKTEVTKLIG